MKRAVLLGFVVVLVFAGVAAILLKVMPQPLKDSDYLVIGSVSTLASLMVLFFMTGAARQGLLLKRRKKR